MTVEYVGGLTIGEALPGVGIVLAPAFADISAKVAALASFTPTVTLDLAGQVSLAGDLLAAAQASLAIGIQPPSISVQLDAVATLLADVRISLGLFEVLFGQFAVGIHEYHYSGPTNMLGSEMTTELAGGFPGGAASDATEAIIIAGAVPGAWAVLSQIFKTSP